MASMLVTATALALMPPPSVPRPTAVHPSHTFEVAGVFRLDSERWGSPGFEPFRSLALRAPFVYILDRGGTLHVFELPDAESEEEPEHVTVLRDVGDGNDLAVVGDVLLCSRWGHLEAWSLEDPKAPSHLGKFGPEKRYAHTQTIVTDGDAAFLIGRQGILSYDISDPARPRFLARAESDGYGWTGCTAGNRLYVGQLDIGPDGRHGIAVYDVSDPSQISEVGFVATSRAPYHLFALSDNRLLASLAADSVRHSGPKVHGNAALFDISEPSRPRLLFEQGEAGGRASALLTAPGGEYFVCNGAIFSIGDDELNTTVTFSELRRRGLRFGPGRRIMSLRGSTLDGAPYHGDSDGSYAALAMDHVAIVIRMNPHRPAGPGPRTR